MKELDVRIVRQGPSRMWKTAAEIEQDRKAREAHDRWQRQQSKQWPIGYTPGEAVPKRNSQR